MGSGQRGPLVAGDPPTSWKYTRPLPHTLLLFSLPTLFAPPHLRGTSGVGEGWWGRPRAPPTASRTWGAAVGGGAAEQEVEQCQAA